MPLANQLHVDRLLSEISIKYQPSEYIAQSVFPELMVEKDSDRYRVYVRNFRIPETKRDDKALAREHSFDVTNNSYLVEKHALKDFVSDDQSRNYDIASLRADVTEELTNVILRSMEKKVADLFTTTNWSLNVSLAAANAFSANTTVSNPIPVVDTGASTIIQNSGFAPTFGILPRDGFVAVKNHVSVLDRTKYTSSEISKSMIQGLFDLQELLVPNASQDTSALGLAESITSIWGDNMFLGYKPSRPSPLKPSSGYIFRVNAPMVKRWREEERESEAIEVQMKYVPKIVASLSGYLIRDII